MNKYTHEENHVNTVTVCSDCSPYDTFRSLFKKNQLLDKRTSLSSFVLFQRQWHCQNLRNSDQKYESLVENYEENCQLFMGKPVVQ